MSHDLIVLALVAAQLLTAAMLTRWKKRSRPQTAPVTFDTDHWPALVASL